MEVNRNVQRKIIQYKLDGFRLFMLLVLSVIQFYSIDDPKNRQKCMSKDIGTREM